MVKDERYAVLAKMFELLGAHEAADILAAADICPEPEVAYALRAAAEARKAPPTRVALFRHGAELRERHEGRRVTACGVPTVFEFSATNLEVSLTVFGSTSPFHDCPDGGGFYVEIGVDPSWASDELKHVVTEFERHGRRPKGPPRVDLDVPR